MKKCVPLLLSLILLFSGCSNSGSSSIIYSTDSVGNTVIENEGSRTTIVDELPYELQYNGVGIPIVDVSVYENKVNHSYHLFVVTTLDVSGLDEDSLHWLRHSDLDVHVYIEGGKNEYDFDTAPVLGSIYWTDVKQLVYVHTSSFFEENRYSFAESELTVTLIATQEEEYVHKTNDGRTIELNKKEEVMYNTTLDGTIPHTDDIDTSLADYIGEWLHNRADWIGQL